MANIQSLPNELLEDVLGIACCGQLPTPHWQQLQLSHTNQRFREIVTNDASLWTHITFKSSVEWVELLLRRSGGFGLIIDMSAHHNVSQTYGLCPCPDMLSRVYEHRGRWKEVRFGTSYVFDSKRIELLKNITLPSLVRITSEDRTSFSIGGSLCLSWNMPSLEHLQCTDGFREVVYELPIPLKSLRYMEDHGWTNELIILHKVMEAKSVAGVEELTFGITLPLYHMFGVVYNTVRMENLRSFTVEILNMTPNQEVKKFFGYLELPALEVFKFKHDRSELFTGYNSDEDYLHCLNWLFVDYHNIRTKYPKLKEVHITIDGVEDEKLCEKLRLNLDGKFRIEWFGGDNLGVTGEEEYTEVIAIAPRLHLSICPKLDLS